MRSSPESGRRTHNAIKESSAKYFSECQDRFSGLTQFTHAARPCLFVHPAGQCASLVSLYLISLACLALLIQLVLECGSKGHGPALIIGIIVPLAKVRLQGQGYFPQAPRVRVRVSTQEDRTREVLTHRPGLPAEARCDFSS